MKAITNLSFFHCDLLISKGSYFNTFQTHLDSLGKHVIKSIPVTLYQFMKSIQKYPENRITRLTVWPA